MNNNQKDGAVHEAYGAPTDPNLPTPNHHRAATEKVD
jgi:hypothetical protein